MLADCSKQKTTRNLDWRSNDPEYEALIQDTLARVSSGEFQSFRKASVASGVSAKMLSILN